MGVAFRELPGGRSRWRLPQSRDRGLQGSTHCGYRVHGSHLLPMDHDRRNHRTPATRCATDIHAGRRVAVERAADRCTLICDDTSSSTPTARDPAGEAPLTLRRRQPVRGCPSETIGAVQRACGTTTDSTERRRITCKGGQKRWSRALRRPHFDPQRRALATRSRDAPEPYSSLVRRLSSAQCGVESRSSSRPSDTSRRARGTCRGPFPVPAGRWARRGSC